MRIHPEQFDCEQVPPSVAFRFTWNAIKVIAAFVLGYGVIYLFAWIAKELLK